MRKLILIKHARPQVDDRVPSHDWPLSAQGRESCRPLARLVAPHEPVVVVTSNEPKAAETGRIVGAELNVTVRTAPGLHEHDRANVPMMDSREFISTVALFFKDRGNLVLGLETADAALARFERALTDVVAAEPEGNIAVVTHGTVLALFAAAHGAGDAFQLWRRLGLPSMIAFELPGYRPVETVERVG